MRASMNNTDSRLVRAYELLESGKIKVLSLDIFDTLLWRKVPLPIDIFLILGEKLKKEGWLIEAVTAECFAELRVGAECLTRSKKIGHGSIEITLQEIYWTFSGIFTKVSVDEMIAGKNGIINESDVGELVALELALEKQLIEFDLNILCLIHQAKQKNIPVILMSDTYFEKQQITTILDRPSPIDAAPFLQLIHTIFLSCEYGFEKRHGLFLLMLNEMKVSPEHILHIGDNVNSDCMAAEHAQIPYLHYCKGNKELTDLIAMEWPKTSKDEFSHQREVDNKEGRKKLLDLEQGDFGLVALRSKLCHHISLVEKTAKEAFYWRYGATVFGPILFGFAEWIYKRCKDLGQSRVFCLLREGRLFRNVIKQCAAHHPEYMIEAEELWGTRQYMMRTCIFKASVEELYSVFQTNPSNPFTIETFCTSLGLDVTKVGKFKKYRHVRMDAETFVDDFVHYLSNQGSLQEIIIKNSFEKRKRYLQHLSTLVDLSSISQMILVDIGWKGTVQGALQMLLYMEGYKISVHGLYLGTSDSTYYALMQGFVREGYLLKAGYPKDYYWPILNGCRILEQIGTAWMQPLIDFDAEGHAITGNLFTPKKQLRQVQLVHQGINAFCEQMDQYIKAGAISWNASSEAIAAQLRHMLIRATSQPTRHEAIKFGSWMHDNRSGINVSTVLAKNAYYERFIGDMFPDIMHQDTTHIAWPIALVAKYDKNMTQAAQTILKRALPDECFLSQDALPVKIFIVTGVALPKRATRSLHLRSNANRSFFLFEKFFSLKKSMQKLRVEITVPKSLVRIKSLRLIVQHQQNSQPEQLVFFESPLEEIHGLQYPIEKQIEPGTFYSKDPIFALEYLFGMPDVYAVNIKLCLEVFRLESDLT